MQPPNPDATYTGQAWGLLSELDSAGLSSVPVGWDPEFGFRRLFPDAGLPLQGVGRISHGQPELALNRLIRGENLHVMRQLESASIDLIYLDPPFFSGRNHKSSRDAKAGTRSFSDVWQGGLPAYLAWLNARLFEARRLLKPSGSLYVHCDWHASHYIKVELDKLFGYECFLNNTVWLYGLGGSSRRYWPRKHDDLLWYCRQPGRHYFEPAMVPAASNRMKGQEKKAPDWWDIPALNNMARERAGYPTQKPRALLERIVASSCPPDGVVADFFCGCGTTALAARALGRLFIACGESLQAIELTLEQLTAEVPGGADAWPDITLEYLGACPPAGFEEAAIGQP